MTIIFLNFDILSKYLHVFKLFFFFFKDIFTIASEGNSHMLHNLKVTTLIVNEFVKKLNMFSKHGELNKLNLKKIN